MSPSPGRRHSGCGVAFHRRSAMCPLPAGSPAGTQKAGGAPHPADKPAIGIEEIRSDGAVRTRVPGPPGPQPGASRCAGQIATQIVEAGKGKVTKTEPWGLRSLAYKIAKNRKAHFILLNIDAPAGVVAELERQTALNEDIIRFMTVRVDEHEGGPSVMMRKQDRERTRRREREGE